MEALNHQIAELEIQILQVGSTLPLVSSLVLFLRDVSYIINLLNKNKIC